MMQSHGLSMPEDIKQMSADDGTPLKVPSRPFKESPRKTQLSQKAGHRRSPSNGLETLLRVSELEFLRTDAHGDHKVDRKDHNQLAVSVKAGVTGAPVVPQSRDEVLAAETLSSMATLGVEPYGPSSLPSTHSLAGSESFSGVDVAATSAIAPFVVAAPSHSVLSHGGGRAAAGSELNGMEAGRPIILQDDVEDPCVLTIERVDTGRQPSVPADTSIQQENAARKDFPHSKSSRELLCDDSVNMPRNVSSGEQVCSQTVTPPEYYSRHPMLASQRSLSANALTMSSSTSLIGPADLQLLRAPLSFQPNAARDRSMILEGQPTAAPPEAAGHGNEGEDTGTLIIRTSTVPDAPVVGALPTSAEAAEVTSQTKPKQHRSRKRHSSDERQLPPGTKKSTVIHTDSSVEGSHSSATSSPALAASNQDTPMTGPPLGVAPLVLKPGETPPLMPYLPMMAVAQKGSVPMIVPPSTAAPGYLMPPVSSVAGTQPSWPFYWPVANTQIGQQQQQQQQQPGNSQMFSALDLQQPAQKQAGPPFVPAFMPSFIPPVGGSSLTPTSLAPSFFPTPPFFLPAQIPSAADPTISGSSTAGSASSWKVPTTSSATPAAGGAPSAAFPFPVMNMAMMQQHLAMMKARGGSTGIHQPTTLPSSPGGLIAAGAFPPLLPPTPGRGVPGVPLNQEGSTSSGAASPSHPPAVFSPPFSVPHMIPSMLLAGTMAPQVIQDMSRSGAASLGNPGGAMNQNRSRQRYQRRRHKQPAQNVDGTVGQSAVEQQSGSSSSEALPPSASSQPQQHRRSRGSRSGAPRNYSRKPKDGESVLKMCSIDEQRLQSLLSTVVRSGSKETVGTSQPFASVNGQSSTVANVQLGESKVTSEVTNTDSALSSSDMDDNVNVTQTDTTTSEGEKHT